MPKTIDQENFKYEVIESRSLSIVQFKSDWNGACQIIAPVYEELARHYEGTAKFFTTDIETETTLEKEYGIHELPTFLFFKSGSIVDYAIGLTPKNILISKIENALSSF
jgi:thioredoxin 1